jgi:hypothetical protein
MKTLDIRRAMPIEDYEDLTSIYRQVRYFHFTRYITDEAHV